MSDIEFELHDKKQCYTLKVGQHRFGISYETFIAYDGPFGRFRTSTRHSQTTDRHHIELKSRDWPRITQDELELLIERAFASYGLTKMYERIGVPGAGHTVDTEMNEAFGPLPSVAE